MYYGLSDSTEADNPKGFAGQVVAEFELVLSPLLAAHKLIRIDRVAECCQDQGQCDVCDRVIQDFRGIAYSDAQGSGLLEIDQLHSDPEAGDKFQGIQLVDDTFTVPGSGGRHAALAFQFAY